MQTFTVEIDGVRLEIVQDTDCIFIVPDEFRGIGSALKPAYEPVCLARKPLSEGTIAANVLRWGTGALNIDATRVPTGADDARAMERANTPGSGRMKDGGGLQGTGTFSRSNPTGALDTTKGRWPANLIHDGSDEVVSAFPETTSGSGEKSNRRSQWYEGGPLKPIAGESTGGDSGSAARFFYTAKADQHDRAGSRHPTIKPLSLIRYLARLVTPSGGLILDPFAGSGTLGEASYYEGFRAVLIEKEEEYCADIERRMALALAGPDERARESIKARLRDKPEDHGPLFDGAAA